MSLVSNVCDVCYVYIFILDIKIDKPSILIY
jgi:hypothetical protein